MGLYPPPAELISHRMRMNTFSRKWLEYLAERGHGVPPCAAIPMAQHTRRAPPVAGALIGHNPRLPAAGSAHAVHPDRRTLATCCRLIVASADDPPQHPSGDHHLGKYNGLGGKIEADEDVAPACVARLQRKLASTAPACACAHPQLAGFGKHGEDWLGFVFVIDTFEGTPHGGNHEGTLSGWTWTSWTRCRCGRATATSCRWCSTPTPRPFHGVMPYKDGRMVSWSYSRL